MRIIRLGAGYFENLAVCVGEAHAMGHGPGVGGLTSVCRGAESAVQIFTLTLTWTYLKDLGMVLGEVARSMVTHGPADGIADEWILVHHYAASLSEEILKYAPASIPTNPDNEFSWQLPSVSRFDLLASVFSREAVAEAQQAGAVVRNSFEVLATGARPCPLTPSQLAVLAAASEGTPIVEIATAQGYSARTINRRLESARRLLDAHSTTDAVRIATARGWISPYGERPDAKAT